MAIPYRVANPVLYGAAHPLGGVVTEASLGAITLDDCKLQLATWMKPERARLFVVGDLTEAQLRALVDSSSLGSSIYYPSPERSGSGTATAAPKLAAPATMPGRIFFVDVPKAAQSMVMLLQHGPERTASDYFPNTMMSLVFGGGFTSRLNMNLREDKGYSYGARGGFSYSPKTYGVLTASAAVQADATYQTLLELDRELRDLSTGRRPVTRDELDGEKTNAILNLPGRFSTAQAALGQFRSLVYYGLPLDYFNTYVDQVAAVTEAQVTQSAARHLKPSEAVYLVVGDGDAPMIVHDSSAANDASPSERRLPHEKAGRQLTLREALVDLATRGDVGSGGLVELDVDGRPLH